MNVLLALAEGINLQRLNNASSEKVINAFLSNYIAALIFMRMQDLPGLRLVNDRTHHKLKGFNSSMSDINFWGRALFFPSDKEVVKRMLNGHASELSIGAGRILDSRIHAITAVPFTEPHKVNWAEAVAYLVLLKHRYEVNSSYLNNLTYMLDRWDGLGEHDRKRAINVAFTYLLQSDPQSALLPRLRALSNSVLLKAAEKMSKMVVGFRKLAEDGEGAAAGTSTGNVGTTNAIVSGGMPCETGLGSPGAQLSNLYKLVSKSPNQVVKKGKGSKYIFKDGKVVKKKVRRWKPIKFKAPPHVKPHGEQ